MRPPVALALVSVAAVLAAPAAATGRPPGIRAADHARAGSARFSFGVAAGDVRSTSAILWGRADRRALVTLQVARDRRFRRVVRLAFVWALRSNDLTVQHRVRGLRPATRYWFRWVKGRGRSRVGTFKTAPRANANATVRFAWSGDTDFNAAPGQRHPFWNSGGVFRHMLLEHNDFNVHLGDTIYSDSEIPGRLRPVALSVGSKWRKYKTNIGNRFLRALRGAAGFYSHWDDHEFMNDFSPAESTFSDAGPPQSVTVHINGHVLYRRGARAFRDYAPVGFSRRDGLYRSFRWGKNLELFFLDERSFRSAKADAGGVCDNPQTHRPDLAPTAPQSVRNVFGAALPASGLSQPVSPACLARIRDPHRTFLGSRQLRRFEHAIEHSTARFKVIMNELPIQQFYANPYDRWEGYEADRQRVLRFLRDHIKGAIFLTTDVHAILVNDARFKTLESGGPQNSGIFDFTVGPVATATTAVEFARVLGFPGAGPLIAGAFFKPPPPAGVGMRCAIVDKFSYDKVRVTLHTLTVVAKGIDGRPLPQCPPLTLHR